MDPYALLDQAEEDALHKTRLLTVEERPFKRIAKRLLDPSKTLIPNPSARLPTPPPDSKSTEDEADEEQKNRQKSEDTRRQWREDSILDFAAFESSIIRIQFLLTSNAQERERYAQKKLKIEETSQAVRDNTIDLRTQLAEAQRTLAVRKEYDELAEKITSNRLLKPRDEQHANLEKLNSEIAELQRESREYAETWNRRRQQFDKIVAQTTEMQRQIKDEKEEVERREGMEDGEDGDDDPKGTTSDAATPKPEATGGAATPMEGVEKEGGAEANGSLAPGTATETRAKSPLRESQFTNGTSDSKDSAQEVDEGEMAEDGEVSPEHDAVAQSDVNADDDMEEGEEGEERPQGDRMDVT